MSEAGNRLPVSPGVILVATATILSIGIFITPFVMDAWLLEKQEVSFNASAEVVGNNTTEVGTTTENGSLKFGRLIEDKVNFTRQIEVGTGRDTIVLVDAEGNITEHLNYDEFHRFNASKKIPFEFVARETGNYTGKVTINVHAADKEGSSIWLDIKQPFY